MKNGKGKNTKDTIQDSPPPLKERGKSLKTDVGTDWYPIF
jgi:hypothetical protein